MKYDIIHGPGKWELMMALFEGRKRRISFLTREKGAIEIKVLSVMIEDGSYESWLITGLISDSNEKIEKLYFNTKEQKGHIVLK